MADFHDVLQMAGLPKLCPVNMVGVSDCLGRTLGFFRETVIEPPE
jgi:hypothetical protein